MVYDVIVVGGGIAGLTSAAFLSKEGSNVLLLEKEKDIGGLVNSFEYNGFIFDGGIRAIENSGIIHPMLKALGIDIEFLKSTVSVGIEDEIIRCENKESLTSYKDLLYHKFPDNHADVDSIMDQIHTIMNYMEILYGIDNPIFLDMKKDRDYLIKKILPWVFKYITTYGKIEKLNIPVEDFLRKFSSNTQFIDIIAQHFFKNTPAFFAMSYFSLYLDYKYPKGGTGMFPRALEKFILEHGGNIKCETKIISIDSENKLLTDSIGNTYEYNKLIWAGDLKYLYNNISLDNIKEDKLKSAIINKRNFLKDKIGCDSVLTLYLCVDIDKGYFEKICSPHLFYTPVKDGLSKAKLELIEQSSSTPFAPLYINDKQKIFEWLEKFYNITTYEISFPVLRDASLAPNGKTGLIISTLMEHSLVKHISDMGWLSEFKEYTTNKIIDVLTNSIFKELRGGYIDSFISSPLTIENRTGNSNGAITGWAFLNKPMPAISSLPGIAKSVSTIIPDVFQAGQWTYSPSGLPISVLTGKLAADKALKNK